METIATETLVVDIEGRVVIPPEVGQKYGLRPGDKISLVEVAEGLLVRPLVQIQDPEVRAWAENWWNSLTEEGKIAARKEAEEYEALSEEERDAIWNQFPVSIEEEDEGDEIDITTIRSPAQSPA